jgi:Flp pilus assembly protein TadD
MQALALEEEGRHREAHVLLEQLVREDPSRADLLTRLAIARAELGLFTDALRLLEGSLLMDPKQANAHNARGICLYRLNRIEDALEALDQALALGTAGTNLNKATVLTAAGRFEDAIESCDRALTGTPADAVVYHDRAIPLFALRRFDEAIACLDQALVLRPGYAKAYFSKAIALLTVGRFTEGWRMYEWRLRMEEVRSELVRVRKRVGRTPLWLGDREIAGKTILLHAEQGFGDIFQFLRFVPMVAAKGAKVILEVPASVTRLAASVDCDCTVISQVDPLPPIDLHCPLMSLTVAFDLQPDTIPSPPAYLRADAERLAMWRERLGPWRRPRIGLIWFGSMLGGLPNLKSMAFEDILTLTDCDADFVALQKSQTPEEMAYQRSETVLDVSDEIGDFSDTAAIMSLLDLVISIDTGPAHLAGALGRPLWLLLPSQPEWRWPDGPTTPWYPSARQFWQPKPLDWETPLNEVRQALAAWLPTVSRPAPGL